MSSARRLRVRTFTVVLAALIGVSGADVIALERSASSHPASSHPGAAAKGAAAEAVPSAAKRAGAAREAARPAPASASAAHTVAAARQDAHGAAARLTATRADVTPHPDTSFASTTRRVVAHARTASLSIYDASGSRYIYPSSTDPTLSTYAGNLYLSDQATVDVVLRDSGNTTVATMLSGAPTVASDEPFFDPYQVTFNWTPSGPLAPGVYTATVTATPTAGGANAVTTFQVGVSASTPSFAITAPAANSVLHNQDPVTVVESGGTEQISDATLIQAGHPETTMSTDSSADNDHHSVTVKAIPGAVPTGSCDVAAQVDFYDAFFASHDVTTAPSTYDCEGTFDLTTTWQPQVIYPNSTNYSFQHSAYVDALLAMPATLTAVVKDGDGTPIRTLVNARPYGAGTTYISWDGKDNGGNIYPDTDTIEITATSGANTKTIVAKVGVDTDANPVTITSPTAGASVAPTDTVTLHIPAGATATYVSLSAIGSDNVYNGVGYSSTPTVNADGTISVPADYTSLASGTYSLGAYVQFTDSLGGQSYGSTPNVSIVTTNPLAVTGPTTAAAFTFNGSTGDANPSLTYAVSRNATVTSVVKNGATVVRTLETDVARFAGSTNQLDWDGTDNSSNNVASGTYTLSVTATAGSETATYTRELDVTRLTAGTLSLPSGPLSGSSVAVTFTPATGFAPTSVTIRDRATYYYNSVGYLTQDADTGNWTGTIDVSSLLNGTHKLYADAYQYDYNTGTSTERYSDDVSTTIANPQQVSYGYLTSYDGILAPHDPGASSVGVGFQLAQSGNAHLEIRNADGDLVRTTPNQAFDLSSANSQEQLTWDGKDDNGVLVPGGVYSVSIVASEPNGTTSTYPAAGGAPVSVTVSYLDLGTLTSPAASDVLGDAATASYAPPTGFAGTIQSVQFYADMRVSPTGYHYQGQSLSSAAATAQPDGTWSGPLDLTNLADGAHTVTALVSWYDASNQYHSGATPAVAVTETHPKPIKSLTSGALITPGVAGSDATQAALSFQLNRVGVVDATITGPGASSTVVATLLDHVSESAGTPYTLTWDGKDTTGTVVADGDYTVHLDVVDGTPDSRTATITVFSKAPATLVAPTDTVTGATSFRLDVDLAAVHSVSSTSLLFDHTDTSYGVGLGSATAPTTGGNGYTWSFDTTAMPAYTGIKQLPNGAHTALATLYWTDSYGGSHTYTPPVASWNVDNPLEFVGLPKPALIQPGGAAALATATADFATNVPATGLVTVSSGGTPGGAVVRSLPGINLTTTPTSVTWDGKDDSANQAPDGLYTITVAATDTLHNTAAQSVVVEVESNAPGVISAPMEGEVVSGTQALVWQPRTGVTASSVSFVDKDGYLLATALQSNPTDSNWYASADLSQLADGPYSIGAVVKWQSTWAAAHGVTWKYTTSRNIVVENTAGLLDLPDPKYIAPGDGNPADEAYTATFGTNAAGLEVTIVVTPFGHQDQVVRTIETDRPSNGQQVGAGCRSVTVHSGTGDGGSDSAFTTYACDTVSWDGRDDHGDVVTPGLYTVLITARSASGSSDTQGVNVGVDNRAPVTLDTPAADSTVSDVAHLSYTPVAGFPAGGDTFPGFSGAVSGVTARYAGGPQTTIPSVNSGTGYVGDVDLPATPVHGAFDLQSKVDWTDPFGYLHSYVLTTPLHTDETNLTLADSGSTSDATAPLDETFTITTSAADGQPVDYVITTGEVDDGGQPITETGSIPAPYAATTVHHLYRHVGTFTPSIVVTDHSGHRRHDVLPGIPVGQAPPTVKLSLDVTRGVAPLTVTATVTGTQPNDDPLGYRVDWGDGTDTGAQPLTGGSAVVSHQFTTASDAVGFPVNATVIDSGQSALAQARVKVGPNVPLAAAVADPGGTTTVNGADVHLSAGQSQPALGITDYRWEFPTAPGGVCDPTSDTDGCTSQDSGTDPTISWAFADPGTYPVLLVVTDPDKTPSTSTVTEIVTVLDKATTSVTTITVSSGSGASVVYTNADGTVSRAKDNGDGTYTLYGLPDGDDAVDVYEDGFAPQTLTVQVTNGVGTATATMAAQTSIGQVDTTVSRISPDVASAFGVDLTNPDNQNTLVVDATITISGPDGDPIPVRMQALDQDNSVAGLLWTDPRTNTQIPNGCTTAYGCMTSPPIGGMQILPEIKDVGGQKALFLLQLPVKSTMLKEFYSVDAVIKNLAPAGTDFSFTKGTATLDLGSGDGLGFPVMTDGSVESASKRIDDIPAASQASVHWVIDGNHEGDWPLSVHYTATLAPVGAPVQIDSQSANVHVYGTSAVQMIVQTGDTVVSGSPFHVRIGLHNVTNDAHVYNAAVSIDPPTATCPKGQTTCWTMLPGDPAPKGFADIAPQQTVFQDFYLLPSFNGQVDFSQSTAKRVTGDASTVPDVVQPLTQANDDPNPPTFTITDDGNGGSKLEWSADKDATGYEILTTTNLADGFGDPIASTAAGQNSLDMTIPAPTPATTTAATRMATLMAAVSTDPMNVVIRTLTHAGKVFDHPLATAAIPYTCFKPGQSQATDSLGSVLTGCLNNLGQGKGWTSKPGTPVDLSGLTITPSGDAQVTLDTTAHTLSVSGAAALGITSPKLGTIPLVNYSAGFSWDLNNPVTLTLDTSSLLGLPVQPGAHVTFSAGGVSALGMTIKAPALLGGSDAAFNLASDPVAGLHVTDAKADFGNVSIAGVAAGGVTMSYTGDGTTSTWALAGSVSAAGAGNGTVSGTTSYDAKGKLTSGSLQISTLSLAGLGTVSPFSLSTTDGTSWTGSGSLTSAGGASATAGFTYTVDTTANSVTKATIAVPTLKIPGLLTLSGVSMTYSGGKAGAWTLAGKAGTGADQSALSGTLTTTATEGIKSGSMALTNVKVGGVATLANAALAYSAASQSYAGSVTTTFFGKQSASVSVNVTAGALKTLSGKGINLNVGALALKDAAFDYDPDKASYALSAKDANAANLLHLANVNLTAAQSDTSWTYTVDGSGSGVAGVGATVKGSITWAAGAITDGSLDVTGVNVGGFLPVDHFALGYSAAGWSADVHATNGGGGSLAVNLDGTGAITGGSLSLHDVMLGNAAKVSIDASMDASGNWSFSGTAALPSGATAAHPFALSLTYSDGQITAAALSGAVSIRNLMTLDIADASFSADTNTYSLNANLTLPGPGGGSVGGSVTITGGVFTSGSFSVAANGPGVPLGGGVFITSGSLSVGLDPTTTISGSVGLAAGPKLPVLNAAAVTGTVTLGWTDHGDGTGVYTLGGTVSVGGQQVGGATVAYDTGTNTATFQGTLNVDVAFASLSGTVTGQVTPDDFTLHGTLVGTFMQVPMLDQLIGGSGKAEIGLNTTGISACAQFDGRYAWTGGFSYTWGGTWPPQPLAGACDLSSFDPLGGLSPNFVRSGTGLRPHAVVAGSSMTVPAGQRVFAAEFVGSTAAPIVTVTAPDGEVFTTPSDPAKYGVQQPSGRYLVYSDRAAKTTYMLFDSPVAGTYKVAVDTTTPVSKVAVAHQVPRPTVTGTLSGTGSARTLNYTVSPVQSNQQVRFIEQVGGLRQVLATVGDASGAVSFTTLAGSGAHTISAEVLQDGFVRFTQDLLTFDPATSAVTIVPAPAVPTGTKPPTPGVKPDLVTAVAPVRAGSVRNGKSLTAKVVGIGTVPARGTDGVVVLVTVTKPTKSAVLTVAGQRVAVKRGVDRTVSLRLTPDSHGRVTARLSAGTGGLSIVDIAYWMRGHGKRLVLVKSATLRSSRGVTTLVVPVAGHARIPSSARAAWVQLRIAAPSRTTTLTVAGEQVAVTKGVASVVNVLLRLDSHGKIGLRLASGKATLTVVGLGYLG